MLTYLYLREFGILRPAGGVLKGSVELLSIGKVVYAGTFGPLIVLLIQFPAWGTCV